MSAIAGGLLERLLVDSTRDLLDAQLRALGWFDAGRRHRAISIIAEPVNWDIPVEANLIAVYVQSTTVDQIELGNERIVTSEDHVVVTVLAESEALGLHLAGDVRDIVAANMGDGRRAVIDVYDYRQATPPQIGYAVVDGVTLVEPASHVKRDWLSHWYNVEFTTKLAYSEPLTVTDAPAGLFLLEWKPLADYVYKVDGSKPADGELIGWMDTLGAPPATTFFDNPTAFISGEIFQSGATGPAWRENGNMLDQPMLEISQSGKLALQGIVEPGGLAPGQSLWYLVEYRGGTTMFEFATNLISTAGYTTGVDDSHRFRVLNGNSSGVVDVGEVTGPGLMLIGVDRNGYAYANGLIGGPLPITLDVFALFTNFVAAPNAFYWVAYAGVDVPTMAADPTFISWATSFSSLFAAIGPYAVYPSPTLYPSPFLFPTT